MLIVWCTLTALVVLLGYSSKPLNWATQRKSSHGNCDGDEPSLDYNHRTSLLCVQKALGSCKHVVFKTIVCKLLHSEGFTPSQSKTSFSRKALQKFAKKIIKDLWPSRWDHLACTVWVNTGFGKGTLKLSMLSHDYNPSIREAEANKDLRPACTP